MIDLFLYTDYTNSTLEADQRLIRQHMKIPSTLLVLPVIAVVFAGCSKQSVTTTPTQSVGEQTNPGTAATGNSSGLETTHPSAVTDMTTEVELSNFTFSQTEIRAKAGSTLTLKLSNTGGTHDFNIDELHVKSKMLGSGESQDLEIKVPADAAGKTYEYYCSVGNHRKMGMVGKLIIE